jgi:hypothetical protein
MNTALSKVHCVITTTNFNALETTTVFGCESSFDLYTFEEETLRCVETSESDYPLTQSFILQDRKSPCICIKTQATKPFKA